MTETKTQQRPKHEIVLVSRKRMSIDGVTEVVSFDESQVTLVTACGEMIVGGKGIHIGVLNLENGRVELDGEVDALFYSDEKAFAEKKHGFLARLFG